MCANSFSRLHARAEALVKGRELVNFAVASMSAKAGRFNEPGSADLQVNFGCHDVSLRADLLEGVNALLQEWGAEDGASVEVKAEYRIPPLHNDPGVAEVVRRVAAAETGEANIVTGWRNPFADDVAFFTTVGAGCYILLGTTNAEKGVTATWHTPDFDIDEDVLPLGVRIIAGATLELLAGG